MAVGFLVIIHITLEIKRKFPFLSDSSITSDTCLRSCVKIVVMYKQGKFEITSNALAAQYDQ